jgi:hypothetical protein
MKKLSPEEYYDHYQIKKRKTTLNNWKKNLKVEVDLDEFDNFKDNKKKYLDVVKNLEKCKTLNKKILKQMINKNDILELLELWNED